MIQELSSEDLIVWPDGTTCFRHELWEYAHMSDDYEVVPVSSPRWDSLVRDME